VYRNRSRPAKILCPSTGRAKRVLYLHDDVYVVCVCSTYAVVGENAFCVDVRQSLRCAGDGLLYIVIGSNPIAATRTSYTRFFSDAEKRGQTIVIITVITANCETIALILHITRATRRLLCGCTHHDETEI